MRKRFEQQTTLGNLLIEDIGLPTKKRLGPLPGLLEALKKIYTTPKWNEAVFAVMEKHICKNNNHTGRPGMNLWMIFVLAQVRNCMNISYDELHRMSNYDVLVRQIMGVAIDPYFGNEIQKFGYQTVIDNVKLLDDQAIREINEIIVSFGHDVFKKKGTAALRLKTDSFVAESNVHFPTDYNLLYDCIRKSLDMIEYLKKTRTLEGWRKIRHWRRDLKSMMRALGRASGGGGKNKQNRVKLAAKNYLKKAKLLSTKLEKTRSSITTVVSLKEIKFIFELEEYIKLMKKHIDLVERRLIKGEKIPHEEKMFSIFETYTEWITKGKKRPSIELGKKVSVTSDQYHLIVDYRVMEHQADSAIVKTIYREFPFEKKLKSWSFDKGFYSKSNKEFLSDKVELLVMPKKGKLGKVEKQEEHQPTFKRYRNKHSAVESNINELEHRGLNRCPDRGYDNFKRYVGLAVCSYNLKKIGKQLMRLKREKESPPLRKSA